MTMRKMADIAGGRHKVGLLASEKFKKEEIQDVATENVLAYISGKKSVDSSIFLKFTRNENKGIDKMFWCDNICRKDYKAFGTVIAFDTTYRMNAYERPLVVIVGVNHHRRTVPFGVALITNGKEETFKWVLQQLLEANDNVAPYVVVTDGDKAMANAIKSVLPDAQHRLCLWHLMRDVETHTNKRVCSGFMRCVDNCNTPQEFEEAWEELMSTYNLREQQWAIEMYENKEKWSEAFMRGQFFAGMRSSQRCESMNSSSTLKTVSNKRIMLYEFVMLYDKVVDNLRVEEDHDDYISTHTFPVIRGILKEIKTQAARIYTREVYNLFCDELEYESRHIVTRSEKDVNHYNGPTNLYWLNDCEKKDSKYIVVYNLKEQIMCCCCAKLESIGLPCRHMFAVMKYEGMVEIPKGCILRRWTIMKAKTSHLVLDRYPKDGDVVDDDGDERGASKRFALLSSLSSDLCRFASTSYERTMWLKDKLAKLCLDTTTPTIDKEASDNGSNSQGKKRKLVEEECIDDIEEEESGHQQQAQMNDFGAENVLTQFVPKAYTAGEASNAKDCYEISVFHKTPTVFDWRPNIHF